MALIDLVDWLEENSKPNIIWYIKRLSANDTLANKAHQAGPYIPRSFIFKIFPQIYRPDLENPDYKFDLYVDSHADHRIVRAIWYNNRLRGKTRNESRITGFGGQKSPLLDPESTGALTIFSFTLDDRGVAINCHVWVCQNDIEEDVIENKLGAIEPGDYTIWTPTSGRSEIEPTSVRVNCKLELHEIPSCWLSNFPSGEDIIRKTIEMRPEDGMNPDMRLIRRRNCEYEIFQSIEQATYLPYISKGFTNIESFVALAQKILQSRKSRSGNSLELHAKQIFLEEGLRSKVEFEYKPIIEDGKRPDFIFPSKFAYDNANFPDKGLRMLAVKTTCKDRWRQVINEASRIKTKHLLTLQEGVSDGQFREMQEAGIQLVVPEKLQSFYPISIRPYLVNLESFIADIRLVAIEYETYYKQC